MVAAAVVGSAVVGGMMSADAQGDAAQTAAGAQGAASSAQIAESRRQFDEIQTLLKPFVGAGIQGLGGQMDLVGLNGAEKQQKAITGLEGSPAFTSMVQQGENAILQNASATGGLRGGNTQGALAQFRPELLAKLIDSQYNKLGGLTNVGQNAAAMTGNAGMATTSAINSALEQGGAAQAGAALAGGRAEAQMWGNVGNAAGMYYGLKGF